MKKKEFENPTLIVIEFANEDVILTSTSGKFDEDNWGDNPPGGDF